MTLRAILAIALAIGGLWVAPLRATTYLPVSFQDLVLRADVVFLGEVIDVRPFVVNTGQGPLIKTRVFFQVAERWWGSGGNVEALEFLGGEINGVGLMVAGMPVFRVGERHIVFARRELSINSIVGFTQGLLRVEPDSTGTDRVLTFDRLPLDAPESVGTQSTPARRLAIPMRLLDLRNRIVVALAARRNQ